MTPRPSGWSETSSPSSNTTTSSPPKATRKPEPTSYRRNSSRYTRSQAWIRKRHAPPYCPEDSHSICNDRPTRRRPSNPTIIANRRGIRDRARCPRPDYEPVVHRVVQRAEFQTNILEGNLYYNGPAPPKDPNRHTLSRLLQCHRKAIYARQKTLLSPSLLLYLPSTVPPPPFLK
ncbi:Vng6152h (plasmid) [Halobacterium salinarum NRC-1]|uniref:Vng6152h n=1 Tax=Halobacterium salinarum (strain ATCC 700922 / JCM 11081 / NRC-1) TaxID=64091 RepID=Q9HHZ8_HALSA|nr:Vng6152h [Halobacterium salinarum NRC-1]